MPEEFDTQVERIAALGEPVRRELYQYVVAQDTPVGREQAAAGAGVAHHTAKFHLDKLVADGLLDAEYARPPGRGGPGAGRPAKLYRRAARDISVNLPDRRYELAGHVMAEAITIAARDDIPIMEALRAAAAATGRSLTGGAATGEDLGLGGPIERVGELLASNGYEPRTADGTITMANCPFHNLAQTYTELVCGMNLGLIDALLDGLGRTELRARLDPGPGRCCVTVTTR
ncbi:metalloregulator ArsR/SmtB family transcription factor [Plantactinospora sp. BB1]|uniref:helix-turn-helix transcriptional regulator n=1 Tax=Plantactinospora sp. BB1 TaxID=2071627 RepID=UPI000D169570|nr:helix-turn-helix domain-containing protein [Plantactinospora sp. BB1]AVT37744.1 transcriptional regulator [Plantactinospora sp. BB1]